jgi:hypothetical protein
LPAQFENLSLPQTVNFTRFPTEGVDCTARTIQIKRKKNLVCRMKEIKTKDKIKWNIIVYVASYAFSLSLSFQMCTIYINCTYDNVELKEGHSPSKVLDFR